MKYLFFKDDIIKVVTTKKNADLVEAHDICLEVPKEFDIVHTEVDSDGNDISREKNYKEVCDSLDYSDKRQVEYPPIGDQLDYIYHNGLTKWKDDMIKPVKDKYSK